MNHSATALEGAGEDMQILRRDNVGVVVDELEAATALFVKLDLDLGGRHESRDVVRTASSGSTESKSTPQ